MAYYFLEQCFLVRSIYRWNCSGATRYFFFNLTRDELHVVERMISGQWGAGGEGRARRSYQRVGRNKRITPRVTRKKTSLIDSCKYVAHYQLENITKHSLTRLSTLNS